MIEDLIDGQYRAPARIVTFNTAEGWSRDVSEEIADELRVRINRAYVDVPPSLQGFLDRYAVDQPLQLMLPLKRWYPRPRPRRSRRGRHTDPYLRWFVRGFSVQWRRRKTCRQLGCSYPANNVGNDVPVRG